MKFNSRSDQRGKPRAPKFYTEKFACRRRGLWTCLCLLKAVMYSMKRNITPCKELSYLDNTQLCI